MQGSHQASEQLEIMYVILYLYLKIYFMKALGQLECFQQVKSKQNS